MSGLVGSELLGAGSVRLAGGDEGSGGGGGSGDALIIGKFTGTLATAEGNSFSYLADPGQVASIAAGNEVDPQLYPTGARTFQTLRVTAVNGNPSLNDYTVELYKNGVATLQAVIVPAGAAVGAVFSDSANPQIFAADDTFDVLASVAISDIVRIVSVVLEGPPGGGGGGGGSGTISRITSVDGSVTVLHPTGPTVDLSVPLATQARAGRMSATQWQQLGLDWWSQRTQRAIMLLNATTVQVDSPKRFDLTQWPPLTFGTTPPTPDTTRSGVYDFAGVSDAALQYSPTPGSLLLAQAQTESFFFSVRVAVQGAALLAGEFVLLGLIDLPNVANPAGSGQYVKIGNNSAFGLDGHLRLWLDNGALSAPTDLGVIGGANIPLGSPFDIDLYNDLSSGELVVAIQDTEVARLAPSPTSPLNSLPTVPLQLVTSQNSGGTGMTPRTYGGFAMLKAPTL